MKLKTEMDSVELRLGLGILNNAAYALHNMGFCSVVLFNIAEMRVDDYYFPEDYRDCPCCDENRYDDGYASSNWGYESYGDGAYEDAYAKTPRDLKRDRARRNTVKQDTYAMRGWKSK